MGARSLTIPSLAIALVLFASGTARAITLRTPYVQLNSTTQRFRVEVTNFGTKEIDDLVVTLRGRTGQVETPDNDICGDGPLRAALENEAQALGLAENMQFLGFCSDIINYLAVADVFVHVPLWEGLGIAVIEALAAGLPVVASRVGGIPELVEDGRSGLLVPSQEPAALAAAIERVIHDLPSAQALGTAGQSSIRTRYDVSVMAQANEELYYKLLMRDRINFDEQVR